MGPAYALSAIFDSDLQLIHDLEDAECFTFRSDGGDPETQTCLMPSRVN